MKAGGFPSVFGYSRRASDRCGDGGRVFGISESLPANCLNRSRHSGAENSGWPLRTQALRARQPLCQLANGCCFEQERFRKGLAG